MDEDYLPIGRVLIRKLDKRSKWKNPNPIAALTAANDDNSPGVCRSFRYREGEMVWGKVKSHPWWPGQIFNPAFASATAKRCRRSGHMLVAFFGDATFGWFTESNLVHFEPTFEKKRRQTLSRSFIDAVEDAVDELARRSALGLMCSCVDLKCCVPRQGYVEVTVPGYDSSVIYPDWLVKKAKDSFRPAEMLDFVKQMAVAPKCGLDSQVSGIKAAAQVRAFRSAVSSPFTSGYCEALRISSTVEPSGNQGIFRIRSQPTSSYMNGKMSSFDAEDKFPINGHYNSDISVQGREAATQDDSSDREDRFLFKRREPAEGRDASFVSGAQEAAIRKQNFWGREEIEEEDVSKYVFQKRSTIKESASDGQDNEDLSHQVLQNKGIRAKMALQKSVEIRHELKRKREAHGASNGANCNSSVGSTDRSAKSRKNESKKKRQSSLAEEEAFMSACRQRPELRLSQSKSGNSLADEGALQKIVEIRHESKRKREEHGASNGANCNSSVGSTDRSAKSRKSESKKKQQSSLAEGEAFMPAYRQRPELRLSQGNSGNSLVDEGAVKEAGSVTDHGCISERKCIDASDITSEDDSYKGMDVSVTDKSMAKPSVDVCNALGNLEGAQHSSSIDIQNPKIDSNAQQESTSYDQQPPEQTKEKPEGLKHKLQEIPYAATESAAAKVDLPCNWAGMLEISGAFVSSKLGLFEGIERGCSKAVCETISTVKLLEDETLKKLSGKQDKVVGDKASIGNEEEHKKDADSSKLLVSSAYPKNVSETTLSKVVVSLKNINGQMHETGHLPKENKKYGSVSLKSSKKQYASRTSENVASKSVSQGPSLLFEFDSKKQKKPKTNRLQKQPEEPTALCMKFPQDFALPSEAQLKARFVRFGRLDVSGTRIYCHTSSAQVVFKCIADAEAAYKHAIQNSLFGQAKVKFKLKKIHRPSKETASSPNNLGNQRNKLILENGTEAPPQSEADGNDKVVASLISIGDQRPQVLDVKSNSPLPDTQANELNFFLGTSADSKVEEPVGNVVPFQDVSLNSKAVQCLKRLDEEGNINTKEAARETSLLDDDYRLAQEYNRMRQMLKMNSKSYTPSSYSIDFSSTSAASSVPDISHQMLTLLRKCSDIISDVQSSMGFVPYPYPTV